MHKFGEVVRTLSLAALGVYAGAMLTEAMVLVPHWQSLPADDFFAWYAANDKRLLDYFGAVTSIMAVLALAASGASLWEGHPARWYTVFVAVVAVGLVLLFPLYFADVNAAFAAGAVPTAELPAALSSWAFLHWIRTVFSFIALGAALLGSRIAIM